MIHFLFLLCVMVDVACSVPHAFQDSHCGPRVAMGVAGDVPLSVGGLCIH